MGRKLIDPRDGVRKTFGTPKNATRKTRKTPEQQDQTFGASNNATSKTRKTAEEDLGLIAMWSHAFGFVSVRDPLSGEWYDLQTKDAPAWATWEARVRKTLYGAGNRRAYRLTARQMEDIWEAERPAPEEEGIIEEYPVEEEDE